jgi:hypothetical protein
MAAEATTPMAGYSLTHSLTDRDQTREDDVAHALTVSSLAVARLALAAVLARLDAESVEIHEGGGATYLHLSIPPDLPGMLDVSITDLGAVQITLGCAEGL